MLRTLREPIQRQLSTHDAVRSRVLMIGTGVVVAISYFLAARLGLALLSEPEGVAVFWPASGVAAGILTARGPNARRSVAIGVIVATLAANLMSDRSLLVSIAKSGCNAGEALLIAWLIERSFGHPFALDSLRRTIGFFIAATIGTATAAVGGAAAMSLFHKAAPFLDIWRTWFLASELGILTIAPLVIGIVSPARNLPPRRELMEGTAALVGLAVTATYIFSMPPGSWLAFVPVLAVFPLLLWMAARCQQVLAAAAVFVVASACVWEATFGQDRFGGMALPISDRIHVAQAEMFITTLCALVLAALFAERQRNEGLLNQGNRRLELALDGAELGAFNADLATGHFECDARTARIHGHNVPPTTIRESRRFIHRGDLKHIDDAFAKAPSTGGIWHAEYRVMHPPNHPHAGETRWVAVEGSIVRDPQGHPVGLLGVTRDITGRKQADQALAESHAHLELASGIARVGTFTVDIAKGRVRFSPGCAALYGLPEGTVEISRDDGRALVHPEDLARVETLHNQAFLGKKGELITQFRIVRADNEEVRWLEARCLISYDEDGRPLGMVGVSIDVTERKQAEDHKALLVSELDHRVKNTLSCVTAIAEQTRATSNSMDEFLEALRRRIGSLANTHGLLSLNRWRGVDLAELVRGELVPCMSDSNTLIDGPAIDVSPDSVQTIAIVLHELATNAAKYGALSNCTGQVSVRWHWQPDGGQRDGLVIEWCETGGPSVTPSIPGYGTSVIRDLIPYELGGTVDYILAADGARCKLEIPARWLRRRMSQNDATNEAGRQAYASS